MTRWHLGVAAVVILGLASGAGACGDDDDTDEAFSFANNDLCEWVTEDEVADFVADEFDWDGSAIEVEPEDEGVACQWELTGADEDSGAVIAGLAQWEDFGYPEEVVEFDEGTVDVGAWVTGHPALDAGVVLHNGAFGRFYFGVPHAGDVLLLTVLVPDAEWDADYEARYFAVADHFLQELGWNPDR